ncbi:MAG: alpha/beta hydrolase [Parvularculaceae bacterium]
MLDPQTEALLRELNAMTRNTETQAQKMDIAAARSGATATFARFAGAADRSDCCTLDMFLPGGDGEVPARFYWPAERNEKLMPIIMFFHGGGWSLGEIDSYDGLLQTLSALSGAGIISLDYRLAPEHPFPAGLEDCLAATRWVAQRLKAYGASSGRYAVMGDSSGGNLAAAVARRLRREGLRPPLAQFLLYPLLDLSKPHSAYPTRMKFGGGDFFLSRDAIDATANWYLPDDASPDDPDISPLLAEDIALSPPTVVLTAGFDPLRDEGRAYAQRLEDANAPVIFKCYETTIHGFLSFSGLDVAQQARIFLADQIKRWLISGEDKNKVKAQDAFTARKAANE